MVGKPARILTLTLCLLPMIFIGCGGKGARDTLRIGHSGGYLSAALYAAKDSLAWADIQEFNSTTDIAYALILGRLDAGFVEAEKLAALAAMDGFDKLTVIGKVTYPYGATLILRKGLNVRLQELGGLTVAASEPECVLRQKFAGDASRLGADISGIKDEFMTFHAMIPALEAGVVDAALIKGSYAVAALQAGHSILYQNWDVVPGDECCPAIIAQAALILLARRDKLDLEKSFVDALISAQKLPPDSLRNAVAKNTILPLDMLSGQPVPEFSPADDSLIEIFVETAKHHEEEEGSGHHGDDNHKDGDD